MTKESQTNDDYLSFVDQESQFAFHHNENDDDLVVSEADQVEAEPSDSENVDASAELDGSEDAVTASASVEIQAEPGVDEPPRRVPTFHMVAYTGGAMVPCAWSCPVVIELSGIKQLNKLTPIRFNHDSWTGVGHATKVYVRDGALQADGVISRDNEYARDVVSAAKNGFPWQVSVGGRAIKKTFCEEGASVVANGKRFKGPITYVEEFELCEISFCDLGADSKTSASVAASHLNTLDARSLAGFHNVVASNASGEVEIGSILEPKGKETMSKEEKLDVAAEEHLETIVAQANEGQEERVEASADTSLEADAAPEPVAELEATANEGAEPVVEPAPAPDPDPEPVAAFQPAPDIVSREEYRKEIIANTNRKDAIMSVDATGFEDLRAQAIEEGWSFKDFNVALKAARHDQALASPKDLPRGAKSMNNQISDVAIEASIVTDVLGDQVAQRYYDERTLNDADSARRKLRCFRDVFSYATQSPFYREDLRDMNQIQAAFTTSALEKIFRNVVNKALLAGYETVTDDWRKFCSVSRANDFKPVYNYRVGGDFTYKEISNNANEISNATFSEEEYTNSVKSYALMYTITRQMLYNDDLNALSEYPKRLGQGAAETLNDEIYRVLLANATCSDGNAFYSTAHNNYRVATSQKPTALALDTLAEATEMFETQETPDGRPIAQDAKYLFVPTALKTIAWRLLNSIALNETTQTNLPAGAANPFYGKYEIVSSPYLQSKRYANANAANWYLFGDPNRISAIDVVFLNGVERPTIEQGNVAFDQLGIAYRGVFDFGVKQMDWRGTVLFAAE